MSTPPAQPAPAAPTVPLPDDLAVCQQMIRELLATLQEQRQDNAQLRARLDLLLRRLYGPRAERFDPNQALLFADVNDPLPPEAAAPPPRADEPVPRRKQGHGRRELPKHLRRERIDYTLSGPELLCPCCGDTRRPIGSTRTEQLDYQPASLLVVEHVRHAYACARCQGEALAAAKPPQPVERGLPGPGLLAHVVVSKYADHVPLYRLEHIFARQGLDVTRSTLCDWMAHAAGVLRPWYEDMIGRVLRTLVVHTDDTPVPVLDPQREHTRTARLWAYLGDWMNPFNVFDYTPDSTQSGPQKFLATFTGFLHADAYGGYDRVYKTQEVVEVACNAHARRKFYDARDSDPARAHQALAYYRQLYDVEDHIRAAEAVARARAPLTETEAALFRVYWEEQIVLQRQESALPIWLHFHAWLLEQRSQVLPKSPLGEALTYALKQYQALTA